jgi:1-acyl-sn-glycerol-3-phosphate acyltransferase
MFRFIWVILANVKRAPYLIPRMRKMFHHPELYSEEDRYALARKLIDYMKASGKITTEVYGRENLPQEGGYVMFPNHQGKYDALGIIYAHDEPCSFVMDKAKSYSFLVKELVDMLGAKRLELDNIRQNLSIINELTAEVKAGKRFILFSEGGYDKNKNKVQQFKPGSFKCAVRAKAPIVPVALIDSYKPFNSLSLGKVTTKVVFLPPIFYDEYRSMKTPDIANMVRNQIIGAMKEFGVDAD